MPHQPDGPGDDAESAGDAPVHPQQHDRRTDRAGDVDGQRPARGLGGGGGDGAQEPAGDVGELQRGREVEEGFGAGVDGLVDRMPDAGDVLAARPEALDDLRGLGGDRVVVGVSAQRRRAGREVLRGALDGADEPAAQAEQARGDGALQ